MATRKRPPLTTDLVPNRRAKITDTGAATNSTRATGAMAKPVWRGLKPRLNCRYWVKRKNRPNKAKTTRAKDAMAAL